MYSDYLSYLKHVDDTTLQELTAETERVRSECEATIKRIEKEAEGSINQVKKDSEESLRLRDEAHATEVKSLQTENNQIVEKLKNERDAATTKVQALMTRVKHLQKELEDEKSSVNHNYKLYEKELLKVQSLTKVRNCLIVSLIILVVILKAVAS